MTNGQGLTGRMPNERERKRPDDGSEWKFKGANGSPLIVLSTTRTNVHYVQDGIEGGCTLDERFEDMEEVK